MSVSWSAVATAPPISQSWSGQGVRGHLTIGVKGGSVDLTLTYLDGNESKETVLSTYIIKDLDLRNLSIAVSSGTPTVTAFLSYPEYRDPASFLQTQQSPASLNAVASGVPLPSSPNMDGFMAFWFQGTGAPDRVTLTTAAGPQDVGCGALGNGVGFVTSKIPTPANTIYTPNNANVAAAVWTPT